MTTNTDNSLFSAPGLEQRAGVSGLYLFAAGAWLSTFAAYVGIGLMLLAFLVRLRQMPDFWKDPFLVLTLCFWLYLGLRTVLAIDALPTSRGLQLDRAGDLARMGLGVSLAVAVWIAGNNDRMVRLLGLALAGFAVRIVYLSWTSDTFSLYGTTIGEILPFFRQDLDIRTTFKMPANAFGTYTAIALFGTMAMAERFWKKGTSIAGSWARRALWLILMVVLLQLLIYSQSRSAWLACAVVFPLALVLVIARQLKTRVDRQGARMLIYLCLTTMLIATVFYANRNVLIHRLPAAADTWERFVAGEYDDMSAASQSIGVRFILWPHGFQKWLQRPLIGWGPGAPKLQIAALNNRHLNEWHPGGVQNYHNAYLEVAVQLGLCGILLLAAIGVVLTREVVAAFRRQAMASDVFLFLCGAMGIFLLANALNVRTTDHYGKFFLYLIFGMAYGGRLTAKTPHSPYRHPDGDHGTRVR